MQSRNIIRLLITFVHQKHFVLNPFSVKWLKAVLVEVNHLPAPSASCLLLFPVHILTPAQPISVPWLDWIKLALCARQYSNRSTVVRRTPKWKLRSGVESLMLSLGRTPSVNVVLPLSSAEPDKTDKRRSQKKQKKDDRSQRNTEITPVTSL